MKRVLKFTFTLLLAISMLLCATSCDGDKKYTEAGLSYALPKSMEEKNYQGLTKAYSDGKAEFILIVWSRAEVADQWYLSGDDFTLAELTETFIEQNEYDCTYDTDESRGVTYLSTEATIYFDSDELGYFYNVLAVDANNAYIVTMDCPIEFRNEYEDAFEKWAKKVKVG